MSDTSTSSTVFDADAALTAPPELRIGGKVYVGRVVSIVEWFAFKGRFDVQLKREEAEGEQKSPETLAAAEALMLEFLRAVFSSHPDDPIGEIQRRGLVAIMTTFDAFFGHTLHALGLVPVQLVKNPTKTDGTSSPDRTTSAPSASDSNSSPS